MLFVRIIFCCASFLCVHVQNLDVLFVRNVALHTFGKIRGSRVVLFQPL